jgi:hypothetical protein
MSKQDYSYPLLMTLSSYKNAEAALLRKDYSEAIKNLLYAIESAADAIHAIEDMRDKNDI